MKAVAKAAAFLYEGMWMVRELCVSYSQNAVAGYANFLVSISLGDVAYSGRKTACNDTKNTCLCIL